MTHRKVSRHDTLLRSLGFKPYEEIMSAEEIAEIDDMIRAATDQPLIKELPDKLLRKLVEMGELPHFLWQIDPEEGNATFVIDEHGNDWSGPFGIDLTPHGFKNNTVEAHALGEQRRRSQH